MYHGVTFLDMIKEGGMKSYEDFHLVPKKRLYIDPPAVKTNMIEVPGGDGYIDASEAPDGKIHFGARTASWEFHVERQYLSFYHHIYSSIMNYLHGRNMRIILDDDPRYLYVGRASVNQFLSEEFSATIVIDVTTQPYKYELESSTEEWLWDPFNFATDYVRGYGDLRIDGTRVLQIEGGRKSVMPTFIVELDDPEESISLEYRGGVYRMEAGEYKIGGVILFSGINTLTFSGDGTVTVEFRGCSL